MKPPEAPKDCEEKYRILLLAFIVYVMKVSGKTLDEAQVAIAKLCAVTQVIKEEIDTENKKEEE